MNLINAAKEAKALGYSSMSAIEFGVAGGNGLIILEKYAKEVSRIYDIEIQVYGFDSGCGLPTENEGYKDMLHFWTAGLFAMDYDRLIERLDSAKLVIGNISETLNDFEEKFTPAPIGVMIVDVDYYSSTVPILNFISDTSNNAFLPRIYMYFDDVMEKYEFQGETLAIKEFNKNNESMKISPELRYGREFQNKVCHRFEHEKYNEKLGGNTDLSLKY